MSGWSEWGENPSMFGGVASGCLRLKGLSRFDSRMPSWSKLDFQSKE